MLVVGECVEHGIEVGGHRDDLAERSSDRSTARHHQQGPTIGGMRLPVSVAGRLEAVDDGRDGGARERESLGKIAGRQRSGLDEVLHRIEVGGIHREAGAQVACELVIELLDGAQLLGRTTNAAARWALAVLVVAVLHAPHPTDIVPSVE